MTEAVYLRDAYLRSFEARVVGQGADGVVLDRTAFYPSGGGQPHDTGWLRDPMGRSWHVTDVSKNGGEVYHHVEDGSPPSQGASISGELDWPRRYAHMRYHTLLHVLSGVVFQQFGSGITGGQIYFDRARMDFSLPEFDRGTAERLLEGVRDVVRRDLPISVRYVGRDRLKEDPTLVRVAADLLPDVNPVRLIDIVGHDVQADGGTHVRSTREVGAVQLDRLENKGARNKRMYVSLDPPPPAL